MAQHCHRWENGAKFSPLLFPELVYLFRRVDFHLGGGGGRQFAFFSERNNFICTVTVVILVVNCSFLFSFFFKHDTFYVNKNIIFSVSVCNATFMKPNKLFTFKLHLFYVTVWMLSYYFDSTH